MDPTVDPTSPSSLLLRPLSSRATTSMLAQHAHAHTHTHIPAGKRIQVGDLEMTVSADLAEEACQQVQRACTDYIKQVFTYGPSWDVILAGVTADPTCVMAHVYATDFFIAKGSEKCAREQVELARTHLTSHQCTDRERMYVDAYEQWMKGQTGMAAQTMEKVIGLYPSDLFAVKRAQLFAFLVGDSQAMLRVVQLAPVVDAHEHSPYYHGMVGFALSQSDQHDLAEQAGRKGVSIEPRDPWAHHAIAHALYAKGKIKQGLQWLREHELVWSSSMSFMHTHAWFHYVLFVLDAHDLTAIPAIFDAHIWTHECAASPNGTGTGTSTHTPTPTISATFPCHDKHNLEDQAGAVGVLMKWELRGAGTASRYVLGQRELHGDLLHEDGSHATWDYVLPELTPRWQDVMSHIDLRPHLNLYGLIFLYGLCRVGAHDSARALLLSMKEGVLKMTDTTRKPLLSQQLLPIAQAICAFHNKEYKQAYAAIQPIMSPGHAPSPPIHSPIHMSPTNSPRRSYMPSSPSLSGSPLQITPPALSRAASSPSPSPSPSATSTFTFPPPSPSTTTTRAGSLLSHRIHATHGLSGSDEQRDVIINDLYLEILFHASEFDTLFSVVNDLLSYRDIAYFRAMRSCALVGLARQERRVADQHTFKISKI